MLLLHPAPDTAPSLTIEKFEQDPRTILLSWLPPLQANGIIQDYVVNVTGLTRPEIFLSYVTTDTTFTVTALHPYHRYLCAVAARTSAGRGPFNTQAVQLPEDGMYTLMSSVLRNQSEITCTYPLFFLFVCFKVLMLAILPSSSIGPTTKPDGISTEFQSPPTRMAGPST